MKHIKNTKVDTQTKDTCSGGEKVFEIIMRIKSTQLSRVLNSDSIKCFLRMTVSSEKKTKKVENERE